MENAPKSNPLRIRRRADIEHLLNGRLVVRSEVRSNQAVLFLDSHVMLKIALRSTDEGPLNFSWSSADALKTEKDFFQ
jgi:hypothetical protein